MPLVTRTRPICCSAPASICGSTSREKADEVDGVISLEPAACPASRLLQHQARGGRERRGLRGHDDRADRYRETARGRATCRELSRAKGGGVMLLDDEICQGVADALTADGLPSE